MKVIPIGRSFLSRYGVPTLTRVDIDVFTKRYFTHCLDCTFCNDGCCSHGVDVDLLHLAAIESHADGLERFTGIPRARWFRSAIDWDKDVPGGGARRTRVRNGRCVFLNPAGRGCLLHSYAIQSGLDYHDLKSMADCLFPLTYHQETLCPAYDVDDDSLVCLRTGPTLYRGLRSEIAYYFGSACVEALDEIERQVECRG